MRSATLFMALGGLLTPVSALSADLGTDFAPRFTLIVPEDQQPHLVEDFQEADAPRAGNVPQHLLGIGPLLQSPPAAFRSSGPLSFSLREGVTAQLGYRHSLLFPTQPASALRADLLSGFSTDRERDVFDLKMSWRLAGSTVGLGYQFQAVRPDTNLGDARSAGVLPGLDHTLHSIMFGVRREWGGGNAGPAPPRQVGPSAIAAEEAASAPAPTP